MSQNLGIEIHTNMFAYMLSNNLNLLFVYFITNLLVYHIVCK